MTKKAIGAAEFSELGHERQLRLLHQDGAYVGKRTVNGRQSVLFQLYGFYVEVHYRQYRLEVDRIETSASTGILQPYIDQVKVRDLPDDLKNDNKLPADNG